MKYPSIRLATLAVILCAGAARADGPADDAAVRNRITCYPLGIDRIGRGDRDGGHAALPSTIGLRRSASSSVVDERASKVDRLNRTFTIVVHDAPVP